MWEWVLGRGGVVVAWGRGYGDNASGGMEISFRWVLMGVMNGFFFDFYGFLCMVVVGVLLPW